MWPQPQTGVDRGQGKRDRKKKHVTLIFFEKNFLNTNSKISTIGRGGEMGVGKTVEGDGHRHPRRTSDCALVQLCIVHCQEMESCAPFE